VYIVFLSAYGTENTYRVQMTAYKLAYTNVYAANRSQFIRQETLHWQ